MLRVDRRVLLIYYFTATTSKQKLNITVVRRRSGMFVCLSNVLLRCGEDHSPSVYRLYIFVCKLRIRLFLLLSLFIGSYSPMISKLENTMLHLTIILCYYLHSHFFYLDNFKLWYALYLVVPFVVINNEFNGTL